MKTLFKTNIDCCKKFMAAISSKNIEPHVNDMVIVYTSKSFELQMKVVQRTWKFTDDNQCYLVCELHLPDYIDNIPQLEGILRTANISLY